jgi:hypothetical protein
MCPSRPAIVLLFVVGASWSAPAQGSATTSDAAGTPQRATTSRPADRTPGYWESWFARSDRIKAEQPHWITPLATTTPRLEQEFRYDIAWQQARPGAPYVENYGGGKGLELIPFDNVEIIAAIPPYVVRHNARVPDGFGDIRFLAKYRMLSANEEHAAYIVTAFLDVAVPTGQGANHLPHPVITPTIAYGKGLNHLDLQGTFSVALPTGGTDVTGRTYSWNNAIQYQVLRRLWPEVEINAIWIQDGPNDGRMQAFVTPGIVVGRLPLTDRLGLTIGAGVQMAVSAFHTSTHNVILSVRLPF